MAELRVRPYRDEDEPEVLEMLRQALGVTGTLPQTPASWRWKHLENPFGPSPMLLAFSDGELAGLRAYLRWELLTPSGERLRALRAVDTATHRRHRRKGVFRTLTREANRRAEAEGVDLIFNTPNRSSLPGYLSMGWRTVGKPPLWIRPLRLASLLPSSGPTGEVADPELVVPGGEPCGTIPEAEDRPPAGLRTPRTPGYLAWRFVRHPTVPYRLVRHEEGAVIVRPHVRSGRNEGVVSEILQAHRPGRPLRTLASRSRADYLVASARQRTPEGAQLVRTGFLPLPRQGLTLVCNPLSARASGAVRLSAWDLSLGDLELM